MKQKNQKFLYLVTAFMALLSIAVVFTTCDMVYVDDSPSENSLYGKSKILTENEKNELEKYGRFLKLICMPNNTQIPNIFSVAVANSANSIAKLDANKPVCIYMEKASSTSTVYLPLAYNNDTEFIETGMFYTAFAIHVDAVKKYVVDLSDKILVEYTDGRGTFDVRNIPQTGAADLSYLTIFNLPDGFVSRGISNVFVHNMYNPVASCKDYSLVEVFTSDGVNSVKIPLNYSSSDSAFKSNGNFYVSFNLYCDALSNYSIAPEDRITVNFVNGNGYLDIGNLEYESIPYLTITGLPLNITKYHFSNVNVYNIVSSVAGCNNNNNIIILKDSSCSTALIPLTGSESDYFRDTGAFIVTFTVNIDALTQISYTRNDALMLDFINGNASFGVFSNTGFFDAELLNPLDSDPPIIKKGSSFEIGGLVYNVKDNILINAYIPEKSCIAYLYTSYYNHLVSFEISSDAPVFDSLRKGWYNGNKRALWKMVYLANTNPKQFLFKTYVEDDFPHNETVVLTDDDDFSQIIISKPVFKSFDGANNPPAETFTLNSGVYVFELKGAGGGSGNSYNGSLGGIGGTGGLVREIITLNSKTEFTAFTGSAGEDAPPPSTPVGQIYILHLRMIWLEYPYGATLPGTNDYTGAGGGGGGSAAFILSNNLYYLLSAGGGGGGSGCSYLTPGGAGGAGGSIGPGAGGGGSGLFRLWITAPNNFHWNNVYANHYNDQLYFAPGGSGGKGGGLKGGLPGQPAENGLSAGIEISSIYDLGWESDISFSSGGNNSVVSNDVSTKFVSLFWDESFSCNINNLLKDFTYTSDGINTPVNCIVSASFSEKSGSGGNTTTLNNNPFNANNVGGKGAEAPSLNPSVYSSRYTNITIGDPAEGLPGEDGGNNRNSERGGGSPGGSHGSVKIYKIY